MSLVKEGHDECDEWVGDYKKEDIEEKGFEVEGENGESRFILPDKIERHNVRNECGEEHVYLKNYHHLGDLFIAQLRNSWVA